MSSSLRFILGSLPLACVLLHVHLLRAAPTAAAPSAPPHVASDDPADRAAKLRDEGNQAMLEMRYVDALSSYQQSLELEPDYVGVLYSISRAHQLLGEFPEALSALEQFERKAAPEVKARVGRLDQLFAELRARVGNLHLSCNVAGARVLFRDKVIGTTPLAITRIPAGAATLEVELEGFFPQRKSIVVPAGGTLVLEVELHARSGSGLLVVHTSPAGARISVDGLAQGTSTPSIELVLTQGPHRVTAQREGYDEASVPVVLNAGMTRTLDMPLERAVPVTSRWWFWIGTGAVLAGGAFVTAALLTERSADRGSLTPGQISAPLRF